MPKEDLDALQEKLLADDELFDRFHQNPRAVIEEHDISLTEEEHSNLHSAIVGSERAEVRRRIETHSLKIMA